MNYFWDIPRNTRFSANQQENYEQYTLLLIHLILTIFAASKSCTIKTKAVPLYPPRCRLPPAEYRKTVLPFQIAPLCGRTTSPTFHLFLLHHGQALEVQNPPLHPQASTFETRFSRYRKNPPSKRKLSHWI